MSEEVEMIEQVEEIEQVEAEAPPESEPEKDQKKISGRAKVFVWRDRQRGFLVVTATSLNAAYGIITTEQSNWLNYAQHHKPEVMAANAGGLLYLPQRG